MRPIKRIQGHLEFEGWSAYPQFSAPDKIGRAGLIGTVLGVILGIHLTAMVLMTCLVTIPQVLPFVEVKVYTIPPMLFQWVAYALSMCIFHLSEFFITALYTPKALSADSYLVNHSLMYTVAFLCSTTEFWIRFFFFRSYNSTLISTVGLLVAIAGQVIRSIAMKTCGESFNHFIQQKNGEEHRLVTHGIYHYFRHPSYVGYFYWAVGTQIMLCNPVSSVLFLWAAWTFFKQRIPYEEETLKQQYRGYYEDYMKRTWIGIPFIPSSVSNHEQMALNTV